MPSLKRCMRYNSRFGNAIWTNHALERLTQRGLSQKMAYETFQYPQESKQGKDPGTTEYRKTFDEHVVTVAAKQNEKGEWIILSCWVNPPFPGSIDLKNRDFQKAYSKASMSKKLWLLFKKEVLGWW